MGKKTPKIIVETEQKVPIYETEYRLSTINYAIDKYFEKVKKGKTPALVDVYDLKKYLADNLKAK